MWKIDEWLRFIPAFIAGIGMAIAIWSMMRTQSSYLEYKKRLAEVEKKYEDKLEDERDFTHKLAEEHENAKESLVQLEEENSRIRAVYQNVTDALMDREEYVIALESAVETICSICTYGQDPTGESCVGCSWKSVKDDLIKPYRDRSRVDPAAKSKFTASLRDTDDKTPSEKEADEILGVLYERSCANCWKTCSCGKIIGVDFLQDEKGNCVNWESEEKRNCQNCAIHKFYELEREKIEKGRDYDDLSDEEQDAILDLDCYEPVNWYNDDHCKNWIREGEDYNGRNEQGELSPIVQTQVPVSEAGVPDAEEQGAEHQASAEADRADEAAGSSSEEVRQ